MAEPKKNSLKNTLKDENAESITPASESKSKSASSSAKKKEKNSEEQPSSQTLIEKATLFMAFVQTERFQKIFGLTLLLFSVYLTIAFTSYPFTWLADQDKVVSNLFSPEVKVENWLGKFGALLSHIFIYKWFGVASYIFAFVTFLTGLRITFNIGLFDFRKTYIYSLFFLIFISLTFGYIFTDPAYIYLGGAYGYTFSNMLNAVLGHIGTGVLLFFVFIIFLVAAFNFSFDLSKIDPITDAEEPKPTPIIEEDKIIVNTFREEEVVEEIPDDIEEQPLDDDFEITNTSGSPVFDCWGWSKK